MKGTIINVFPHRLGKGTNVIVRLDDKDKTEVNCYQNVLNFKPSSKVVEVEDYVDDDGVQRYRIDTVVTLEDDALRSEVARLKAMQMFGLLPKV